MKKRLMSLLLILCSVLFIDNCYACPYTYDNYVDLNIEHAYVVGDYVFDLDRGYTPTLEDFAIAARTIPKGSDEYVYEIQIIEDFDYYLFTNIFTGQESSNKDDLNLDLKYVYRASIKNALPKDYDILNCKTYDINVSYTALETEGEGEYKTSARRYVSVQSTNGISEANYCLTTGDTCKPSIVGTVDGNPGVMTIDYETNKDFQRVCVEVKDNDNNTSDVVCDEITVKVDKDAAEVENTNKLETVIEGEPHGLDELFNISYSVSGGIVNYYYYVTEDGFKTKYLLTDLSDLPSGDVEVEVMVRGGNGLVTREKRIIKVKKNVITYDYLTNGGTSASIETEEVMYNGRANLRATAKKDGYEFVGWNTNPDADYPLLELEVKEDVTLYAIFRKNIRADFEIYNEAGDIPAVSEFKSSVCTIYNNETSCDVTVPEISAKVGYVAYGWNKTKGATTAELVGNETITINGDTKYYSVTRDKVGLTATFNHFEDNKLTRSLKKCYLYNGATTCTVNATGIVNSDYEGRRFVGFTESKDNIVPVTGDITISKGHVYYAYYEDVYDINYISGTNTTKVEEARVTFIMDVAGIERKVEEKTIPTAATISGYQTLGWRKDEESTTAEYLSGDKIIVEEDTTFYGVYSKDITLTYTGDAETSNIPARDVKKSYYNSGSKVQSSVRFVLDDATKITKKDSTFLAWKEGNVNHDAGSSITTKDNVTVEATWTFNGCIITLDYQTNGGTSSDKSSVTYIHGSSDPIDVKTIRAYRPGWLFVGWGTNPNVKENVLSTYKPNNSEVKEVTLYAVFKKNVTVNYRLQDTESFNLPVAEQYKFTIYNQEAGEDITLPTANKTKLNYEFLGWSTDPKSIEKEYNQGQVVKVNDNTTFYSVTKNTDALTSSYHYYDGTTKKVDKVSCYRYNNSSSCVTKSSISGVKYNNVGVFAGWSTKADSIAESTKQEITKNTNFYAIYDRVLSVTYNSGVNSVTNPTYTYEMNYLTNDTSIKEFGAAIVLDTPDGIDGYTTLGWREDKTANVATQESGSTVTINNNKTYYGVYKKSLTLSYAANGGDTIPDSVTKTIYYNSSMADAEVASTYKLANAITRTGYSFTGWMVENDSSKTYQAGANISIKKNTKMYAKWEAKSYVVTYDYLTNGGTSVSVGSKNTTYLTNVDLTPTATKSGYEFVGWSTDPDDKEPLEEYKMPFEDITLYAIFKKKVTATWLMADPLAGTIEKTTTSCYKFNKATTCQIETGNIIANAGYTALGFATTSGSKDVVAGNNIFTDIASDKTFYSVTRKTSPLVGTFYYGEGTTSKTMNANCVLYNGATSCTISAPIVPVTYKNAPFVNWSSNKSSYVASNMTISSNKNYYAYYNQILMLTYHDGETNNILTETKELKYIISDTGEVATIPTITTKTPTAISGYTALGWREDDIQSEATQASNQTKQITQSYEYYAVYKRTITLSYNANSGSSTPANQTATQYFNAAAGATNHTFTLAAAIKRPGYTFVNWTKGSTTGTEYKAGTSINILEDTTMYAKWNVNTYKVTFDANGGSAVNTTMTVTYDKTYGTLPTTTLAHNEFLGWYTAKTGGTKITSDSIVKITSDSTFYAHWQTVTAPVITGGGVNYAPSRTISISKAGTASSGINAYEYYISTSSTSPIDATKATGTTTNTYVFNKNGNSYIWYRTVSKSGIKSVWSNIQQARIDTDKPEADMRVETINGEKYLVFDTYDTISGIDKLLDKDGNPIASKEIPLKIYVNGYGTADRTDTNNYEQLMKDMGYTNYSINQGSYPTAATLKSGGYNVFVDNKNVWAASETLNTYFANGINVVSVGNDSTSVLTPISVNYATTEPSVYSPKISNVFTKKLGMLDNGASQIDSRQRIKFASGTEVLYKEVFDSDGAEYDGIGYYTANGTKWIHSQMALNTSLLPFIDASLSYMSNKGLYYYKLEYKGVNKFTLYDKAGNIKELSYDYSKTLPNLSVSNSELYSAYNTYNPTNTITYDGNGALTVTSSDTGIASVSLSGKTITIKGGSKAGTATITVKAAETSVYNSRQVTFTVNNRLPSSLAWGTGSIKGKTITLPFTYTGDGALSVSVNDTAIGTATVNAANKTVTVNALSVGQLVVTLKISIGNQYYQTSISKTLTFGDAADSNSSAFQEALTTWGKIGTATDANWYGSTTDSHIYAPDGSYVILESVNTGNYTGYYFKEKQPDGTYAVPSYKDITLDFDMTSTNSDDDAMGAMIRFNPEATTNYWSGYLLFLDKHDSNSGIGNGAANGLWRANNKQFSDSGLRTNSTKLVTNPAIVWTRNQWTHYKFQAKGTKITVWSWPTNPNGKYVVSDQAKIFEYNDTSASAIKAGTYGFWCHSQAYTQFKNFVAVTSNGEDFEITIED